MRKLRINLGKDSYNIYVKNGILNELSKYVSKIYKNKKIYIITDDKVGSLYLDKVINALKDTYDVDYVMFKHGEASKNIKTYIKLCEELLDKGIRRKEMLIALGGGVVGDVTGFVASSLYRGIPYIGIPTSLLAQMDSSIGGKTAVDFAGRKNILGAFKQPSMVIIDPETHKTLSKREFNNGMGELIKHGAIGNRDLLMDLLNKPSIDEDIIVKSLSVKKKVVEEDVLDLGARMTLNFGHTFGHIIELKYHYKHGEAVSIGMLMALKMGEDLGITDKECYPILKQILTLYKLPVKEYDYKEYLIESFGDKKNIAGTLNFILLDKLGNSIIYKLTETEIKEKLL